MNDNLPHKPPRLPGYDYMTPGYYFITFNSKLRGQNILCTIHPVETAALGETRAYIQNNLTNWTLNKD